MLGRLADLGRFRPIFSSLDAPRQIIDRPLADPRSRPKKPETGIQLAYRVEHKRPRAVRRLGLSCSSKSSEAFRFDERKLTDQDRFRLVIDQIVGKAFDV